MDTDTRYYVGHGVAKHRGQRPKRVISLILLAAMILSNFSIIAFAESPTKEVLLDTLLAGSPSGTLNSQNVYCISVESSTNTVTFNTQWDDTQPIFGANIKIGNKAYESITKNDTAYEAGYVYFNEQKDNLSGITTSDNNSYLLYQVGYYYNSDWDYKDVGYVLIEWNSDDATGTNKEVSLDSLLSGNPNGTLDSNDVYCLSVEGTVSTISFTTQWDDDTQPIFGANIKIGDKGYESITKNDVAYEAGYTYFTNHKDSLSGITISDKCNYLLYQVGYYYNSDWDYKEAGYILIAWV